MPALKLLRSDGALVKHLEKRINLNLMISVLAHGLLLIIFWSTRVPPQKEVIEISVASPEKDLTSESKTNRSGSHSRGRTKGPLSNVQKLLSQLSQQYFPSLGASAKDKDSSNWNDSYSQDDLNDNPLAAWGSGGGTFERTKDYLLYRRIYESVDGSLYYPGVLARHEIEGTINARFVLDATGSCDWHYTQIKGANPYLQLYVLDILKKTCEQNFSIYLKKRVITNVDMSFQFALTEHNNEDVRKQEQFIVGNTLLFYRNSQKSALEWELGPFHGIFPIPAVYLNVPWIQENWDRLKNHKEPLQEFKKQFGEQS
jgi:hypothetical protein